MPTPLMFSALGNISLRHGDDDAAQHWGGTTRAELTGTPVAELQRMLAAIGTYTMAIDGQFGDGTQRALRWLQWFMANCRFRLRMGAAGAAEAAALEQYASNPAIGLTGACDATTAAELITWSDDSLHVTTPLVRVPLSRFNRIERSSDFTTLAYPQARGDEIVVNAGFVSGMDALDRIAADLGLRLHLNQTFRLENVPVAGAVVPPATKSQHLIGQAVDLNIVDGPTVVTAQMFRAHTAPPRAVQFVSAAKQAGLRWGGDFNPDDPVHFDRRIDSASEDYDMHFFLCQHGFALRHPIRVLA